MSKPTAEGWQQPRGYDLSVPQDSDMVDFLVKSRDVESIISSTDVMGEDLFELRHPDAMNDEAAKRRFVQDFEAGSDEYGRWFHFPWRRSLVHYPTHEDHYTLRTYRNKPLIRADEQGALYNTTIAVFGLSVGSNVVDSLVQAGVGNSYVIADHDVVSPSNLNRLKATMLDVGLPKTTVTGRRISEVDPYIEQIHLTDGYTDDTDKLLEVIRPDIIIEEVDNLSVKAKLRRAAGRLVVPLVMAGDIGERSVLDVERYDQLGTLPFNGKISSRQFDALLAGKVSQREQEKILVKVNGLRNLSPRLIDSSMRRGVDIAGFPQLGSTATMGAALATVAVKGIIGGEDVRSGTYVVNPRKTLNLGAQDSLGFTADTLWRFARRNHQQ